jgi:hypothetical protein
MTSTREQLHDILYAGVGPDLYLAERARELHRAIGSQADAINNAGYGEFLGAVQNAAVAELTLNIAKVFERSSTRFKIRSIPQGIALLVEQSDQLKPLQAKASLDDFARAGIDISVIESATDSTFARRLGELLQKSCPDTSKADACTLSRSLSFLRGTRDKAIAHNEVVDTDDLPRAKWAEAESLLAYAKNVSAGLAMAFFESAWTTDSGKFARDDDAGVAAAQLIRLLKEAGIVQPAINTR